jgi:hypothetical protein
MRDNTLCGRGVLQGAEPRPHIRNGEPHSHPEAHRPRWGHIRDRGWIRTFTHDRWGKSHLFREPEAFYIARGTTFVYRTFRHEADRPRRLSFLYCLVVKFLKVGDSVLYPLLLLLILLLTTVVAALWKKRGSRSIYTRDNDENDTFQHFCSSEDPPGCRNRRRVPCLAPVFVSIRGIFIAP